MSRKTLRILDIAGVFVRVGASSFGGWSTTSLLLERELVEKQKVLTAKQLKSGVAFAQVLPGATQVSIVANVGYQLRGFLGALIVTLSYLLPAIGLIVIFAILYFRFAHADGNLLGKLDGLVAALSGVILANAYRIGSKHTTKQWLWLLVVVVFLAKIWLDINALLIIVVFGLGGLLWSWARTRSAVR